MRPGSGYSTAGGEEFFYSAERFGADGPDIESCETGAAGSAAAGSRGCDDGWAVAGVSGVSAAIASTAQ